MNFTKETSKSSALLAFFALIALLLLGAASAARAETITFGSPLDVPATLNTTDNLGYTGSDIPVPPTEQYPDGIVHLDHDGADTALWNSTQAKGSMQVPESGQIVSFRLEGCAQQPAGAPAPLNEIHFQDLVPTGGGNMRVESSTEEVKVPICKGNAADATTITTYKPAQILCAGRGDFVDFNDEGGWDPTAPSAYPSGVPFQVIGSVEGSTMNSYINGEKENVGATFDASSTTNSGGFASNPNEEVMLEATVGTGLDGSALCEGGLKGARAAVTALKQTASMNAKGVVKVALVCNDTDPCKGTISLSRKRGAKNTPLGQANFSLPKTGRNVANVRLTKDAKKMVKRINRNKKFSIEALVNSETTKQRLDTRPLTQPLALRGGIHPLPIIKHKKR